VKTYTGFKALTAVLLKIQIFGNVKAVSLGRRPEVPDAKDKRNTILSHFRNYHNSVTCHKTLVSCAAIICFARISQNQSNTFVPMRI
jgi:hypothetical protein